VARKVERLYIMKADIHPKYAEITATCSCGNVIKTGSTLGKDIHIDVCAACHPFYTGKQKVLDTGGRIDRFNKRFAAGRATNKS
jgi:large subunit ribosomal protein L31